MQGQGSAPASQIAQFRSDGVTAQTGLRLQFFTDSFSRAFGLPETRLVNMISEATPLREERPYVPLVGLREVHYSRPGLVSAYTLGPGPIRGLAVAPPVDCSRCRGRRPTTSPRGSVAGRYPART